MGIRDLPGGLMVKNLPSSAGDMGSIPGWGTKILQSSHTSTREPTCCKTTEPMHSGARAPQLEKRKPAGHS